MSFSMFCKLTERVLELELDERLVHYLKTASFVQRQSVLGMS